MRDEDDDGRHCAPDPRNAPIEAEVVNQSLVVRPQSQSGLMTVAELEQQFALAVRQRELLSDYIKSNLKPGKHFYEIRGGKPTLTKEGAEIILLPHNLAPDYDFVAGPESPPADDAPYQITVKCTLRRKGDGKSFVGAGIGSAGSHHRDRDGNYGPRQFDKYLCHNATLKMAQKSAMIAATLNSTAGSEFFTQDLDDVPAAGTPMPPKGTPKPPGRTASAKPPSTATQPPKPAPTPVSATPRVASELTRAWMAQKLEPLMQEALSYFIEALVILPTETIDDVPLRFVPTSTQELNDLLAKIQKFSMEGVVDKPVVHEIPVAPPIQVPRQGPSQPVDEGDYDLSQWPFTCIVPIPRKGMKRDQYLKSPDTIGSLFVQRHGTDEESAAARQRLWGMLNNYEPKGWVDSKGATRMPSKADIDFRKALDLLGEMLEKKGEKL